MLKKMLILGFFILVNPISGYSLELIVGEERVEPGIVFVFEGAIKDMIVDSHLSLPEDKTDIHIEARVNWDTKKVPAGTPKNGFVPYLWITAKVINQRTKAFHMVDLLPHINLVDNFHYARNMKLPGKHSDKYTVVFEIIPPTNKELLIHRDWLKAYGNKLFQKTVRFEYKNVDFKKIAKATRK